MGRQCFIPVCNSVHGVVSVRGGDQHASYLNAFLNACCESYTSWHLGVSGENGNDSLWAQKVQTSLITAGKVWVFPLPECLHPSTSFHRSTISRSLPLLKILGKKVRSNHKSHQKINVTWDDVLRGCIFVTNIRHGMTVLVRSTSVEVSILSSSKCANRIYSHRALIKFTNRFWCSSFANIAQLDVSGLLSTQR